jgi:hypothetical protein
MTDLQLLSLIQSWIEESKIIRLKCERLSIPLISTADNFPASIKKKAAAVI